VRLEGVLRKRRAAALQQQSPHQAHHGARQHCHGRLNPSVTKISMASPPGGIMPW
jgi:hypothetical protein